MHIARRTLFENKSLCLGHVVVRPSSADCGEIECQRENVMVLPLAGVFAKHENPRRQIVATANHAVLITANTPYRISFPGGIGDRCLTLRFSDEVLTQIVPDAARLQRSASPQLVSCCLLDPSVMLARSLLWHRIATGQCERLDVEETGTALLASTLRALRKDGRDDRPDRSTRRLRAIEAVKEVISLSPERKWTLDRLAELANISVYHLSHVFRQELGVSVYQYVTQARLAKALDTVLDADTELTTIALDAGFASHSHFTNRFRAFFGATPSDLRRGKNLASKTELRKIVTAGQIRPR
jgi:AraC family transcriptional regulator